MRKINFTEKVFLLLSVTATITITTWGVVYFKANFDCLKLIEKAAIVANKDMALAQIDLAMVCLESTKPVDSFLFQNLRSNQIYLQNHSNDLLVDARISNSLQRSAELEKRELIEKFITFILLVIAVFFAFYLEVESYF